MESSVMDICNIFSNGCCKRVIWFAVLLSALTNSHIYFVQERCWCMNCNFSLIYFSDKAHDGFNGESFARVPIYGGGACCGGTRMVFRVWGEEDEMMWHVVIGSTYMSQDSAMWLVLWVRNYHMAVYEWIWFFGVRWGENKKMKGCRSRFLVTHLKKVEYMSKN